MNLLRRLWRFILRRPQPRWQWPVYRGQIVERRDLMHFHGYEPAWMTTAVEPSYRKIVDDSADEPITVPVVDDGDDGA